MSQCVFSTALPLFSFRICSDDIVVTPIAIACSLPATITATTDSAGTSSIAPPFSVFVRPGAMMLAPLNIKGTAPRSTVNFGKMSGSARVQR